MRDTKKNPYDKDNEFHKIEFCAHLQGRREFQLHLWKFKYSNNHMIIISIKILFGKLDL